MALVQTDLKSPTAGLSHGKWARLKLDAIRDRMWSETKAGMLWAVPHFADIWLAMMVDQHGEQAWFTDQVPTAATDDKYLYINMEWFFKLTLDERLFVASHEIMHAMYGHAGLFWLLQKQGHIDYPDGLRLSVNGEMLNVAADYVINDQLVTAKIGKMPDGGLHWPEKINGDMSVLDAYRILYKENKKGKQPKRPGDQPGGQPGKQPGKPGDQPGGDGDGEGENKPSDEVKRTSKGGQSQGSGTGKSFDKVLKPGEGQGKTPSKAVSERSNPEWDTVITAAMESAKLQGRLPANLERLFVKRLQPKADWRDLYRLAVSRKIGNDRYTWDMLEPQLAYRGIGAPGRSTFGCNLVVIAVDTSGSIGQATLDVFLAETMALLEQAKPKRVIFTQCDAYIHEWDECDATSDLYGRKLKGGGGTDFCPVFERVTREGEEPDLLVYLTDLYGSFPPKPSYPVVWGVVDNPNGSAPFGEVVHVPQQVGNGE